MWSREAVASAVDCIAISPFLTDDDVVEACRSAIKHSVAAIVVRQTDVSLAARTLEGSDIALSTTIGFPLGYNQPEAKALEAEIAIEDGVTELDMVINIGKLRSGNLEFVRRDIDGVVKVAKASDVLVKVVIEACYLSDEQIVQVCRIADDVGADFVKTSTGFGEGGATPEAVDLMIKSIGDDMGVKAAGGIRTWDIAVGYLNQGCTRLGVGSLEQVLAGAER